MNKAGILIGYFAQRDEARGAFTKPRRKGYRRAAWVGTSAADVLRTHDPFFRRRIWSAVAAAIFWRALAEAVAGLWAWPAPLLRPLPGSLFPVLAGGFLGLLVVAIWMRRSRFGADRERSEIFASFGLYSQ